MTTTLTSHKPTGTPAPKGSEDVLEKPFAWANDATYVTVPMVASARSEALEVLLRQSMLIADQMSLELARESALAAVLRVGSRAVVDAADAAVDVVSRVASRVGAQSTVTHDRPARGVHPGTEALQQLQEWLNLPLDEIVSIVGLAPSTRQFWRNNPTAEVRPSKAGRLLRFRTAVGLLVGDVGIEQGRHILHGEGWLEPLDEARLVALEARVREQLSPGPLSAPPGLTDLSREQLLAAAHPSGEAAQRRLESSRDTPALALTDEDDTR
jgi:hypothetical protein